MIRAGLRALVEMRSLTRQWPDVSVLAISGMVGTLGAGLLNPVMPLYLGSRGLDLERIGTIFTLGSLLPLFMQPILGALSDRFDRRRFAIAISLLTSLFVPLFALFKTPMLLAAALAAKLMLERSAAPVTSAMVGDRVPTEKRATVFGLLSSVSNFVFVFALMASSAAISALGIRGVFFFAGACFLLGSITLFRLKPEPPREAAAEITPQPASGLGAALHGLASPFRYAKEDPAMLPLFGYQFCFTFALDLFPIYLPLFAVQIGAPEYVVGPLVASSWLAYAFVLPFGGRLSDRSKGRKGLLLFGLLGMALFGAMLGGTGFLPAAWRLPWLFFTWIAMAIPDALFRPASDAFVVDMAPAKERGRFLGALFSAQSIANVLAPISYGLVAKHRSLGEAFLLSAAALMGALLFIARAPTHRHAPNLGAIAASETS